MNDTGTYVQWNKSGTEGQVPHSQPYAVPKHTNLVDVGNKTMLARSSEV
jgi:hypothetical protein